MHERLRVSWLALGGNILCVIIYSGDVLVVVSMEGIRKNGTLKAEGI